MSEREREREGLGRLFFEDYLREESVWERRILRGGLLVKNKAVGVCRRKTLLREMKERGREDSWKYVGVGHSLGSFVGKGVLKGSWVTDKGFLY